MKIFTSILAAAALAACTGGERNVTGDCPADEECSDLTPNGMHFTGADLIGIPLLADPKVTAVGGTQVIELWKELADGEIVALDLPFAASTDNGDALQVMSAGPNAATIEGVGVGGRDLLRITEPDSELLYDRYEVQAAELATVEIVPATFESYATGEAVAFYEGDLRVGIALYDADRTRLVDESMTLTVTGPQPTRSDWDVFRFESIGPGTIEATLAVAETVAAIDLVVVDAVDSVELLEPGFVDPIVPGASAEVCFHAQAGDAASVLGLPWSFEATGPVTPLISLKANCFNLQVNTAGAFTVTARALGVEASAAFTAVAGAARVGSEPAMPVGDARGERARLVAR